MTFNNIQNRFYGLSRGSSSRAESISKLRGMSPFPSFNNESFPSAAVDDESFPFNNELSSIQRSLFPSGATPSLRKSRKSRKSRKM